MFNEVLSLSIITANRRSVLGEYMEYILPTLYKYHIDLYILDGSSNNETGDMVKQYMHQYDNIQYYRSTKEVVAENQMERIWKSWNWPDTEYVWMSSDKFATGKDTLRQIVEALDAYKPDMLVFHDGCVQDKSSKLYYSANEFLVDLMTPLTEWGSSMIKKELIKENYLIDYNKIFTPSERVSFPGIYIYSCAITKKDFQGYFLYIEKNMREVLKNQAISGSRAAHNRWELFLRRLNKVIDVLPSEYDSCRKELYSAYARNIYLFVKDNIQEMRWYGEINFKIVCRDAKYIKRSLQVPFSYVLRIALTPKKWLPIIRKHKYIDIEDYCAEIRKHKKHSRIIIYGAGTRGQEVYARLCSEDNIDIVAVVDRNYMNIKCDKFEAKPIEALKQLDYNEIFVGIVDWNIYNSIRNNLIEMGIDAKKIAKV